MIKIQKSHSLGFFSLSLQHLLTEELNTSMRHPLLFVFILFLLGCGYTSEYRILDEVDSLVLVEKFDSAYQIVLKLNPQFDSEKNLAHYQLLLTQTSYLTYNTLPTDSAIDNAISYYEHNDDPKRLTDAYYYKASCLHERNEDSLAIRFFKKAEEIANNTKDIRQQYKIAESMIKINNQNGNYSIQLNYARKALDYALKSENKNWIAYSYFNLSMAFQYLGMVDSLTLYTKELIPRLGDIYPQDLPSFLSCIGFMFFKNGDLAQAKKYYEDALSYEEVPRTLVNLAEVYTEEGNDDEAYKLWQKAFLMDDDGSRDIIMFNMLQYDMMHHKDLEDACDRMYRIYAIKDSLTSTLKDRTIQEMQQKYDEEVLNHLYESKSMKWMMTTLCLILLVLLMVGYARYKRNSERLLMARHQMLISQYNNEIKQQTANYHFAVNEILRYESLIKDYTNQILQLQSSGENEKKQKEEKEKRIRDFEKRNGELEASCRESKQQIEILRKRITDIVEKSSPILNRGKILYDDVLQNKTTVSWGKDDYKCFVEYYKALHIKEFESIEKRYKNKHLTLRNMLFLILNEMGKDNNAISQIMGISPHSLRVIKHRLQKD